MKKLEISQMENLQGGKLCSSEGYTAAGAVGWVIGGALGGALFYLGAWGGCSIK